MTYFIHVFSLETHTSLDVRIQEMFRVTDGRIYNGYMKSDNTFVKNKFDSRWMVIAKNPK